MLSSRVPTAAVIVAVVVGAVWLAPTGLLAVLLGVLFLAAAREWDGLIRPSGEQWWVTLGLTLGMPLLWLMPTAVSWFLAIIAALWWLVAAGWVLRFPASLPADKPRRFQKRLAGMLSLLPAYATMLSLHGGFADGAVLLLLVFVIVWAADTGAYVCGKLFGRHRLLPAVSPGKTWEGLMGGMVLAVAAVGVGGELAGLSLGAAQLVLFSVPVALASVVGDLTVSMFKRHARVKDSGWLLPGHGGLLDRIDSLVAAAPVFLLLLPIVGVQP